MDKFKDGQYINKEDNGIQMLNLVPMLTVDYLYEHILNYS